MVQCTLKISSNCLSPRLLRGTWPPRCKITSGGVCLFVSLFVCFFFAFFVSCCRPVSSKHFIINLQLIWTEIIPVSCSNPDPIVAIGTAVRVTSKVRIDISSRIVRNFHIMAPTKGWTMTILVISGVAIVAVGYVLFEVSITFVVFQ